METNIFRKELAFLKDSILIISFIKTGEVTNNVHKKPLSIKFVFFNLLLFTILRVILERIHWRLVYPAQTFDLVNIIGFSWQVALFLIFIISFSAIIFSRLGSSLSDTDVKFSNLFNTYYYLSFFFALSPLFDIIASYFGVPSFFPLPFANVSIITIGQLIEAIIIPIITCIMLYQFFKSIMVSIISTAIVGALFPFVVYGPEAVEYIKNHIFQFLAWSEPKYPYHIILWALENLWFCLFIVIIIIGFLIFNFQIIRERWSSRDVPVLLLYILSIFIGYFLGGQSISFPFLISLIIAGVTCWIIFSFLISRRSKSVERMSNWMVSMGVFWALSISFSCVLTVGFYSFFILLAITGINLLFVLIFYTAPLNESFSPNTTKKYGIFILQICIFPLLILLGATPVNFDFQFRQNPFHTLVAPAYNVIVIAVWLGLSIGFLSIFFLSKKINDHFPPLINKSR